MDWYIKVLRNYATFSGRARRKEYWMFVLFNFLFYIAAIIVDLILGTYIAILMLYSLAMVIPSIAVCVRRLHDIGKSGAWFFISFVPLIGGIWMLILMLTAGTPGENMYGPDPKA